MFIVQVFVGTSWSFKISKATVYIYPFKTNDVKMKTIFSLKKTIKITFPWKKCYSMITVLTWIMSPPSFDYHYHCPPIWTCPLPTPCNMVKKTLPPNDLSFSKLKSPHLLRGEDTMWGCKGCIERFYVP